jgi:uncharacterized membrane protein
MQAMVLLLIAVASLGFIAWRKPADKAVNQHPSGRWFVWAGMLVLALYAAFCFACTSQGDCLLCVGRRLPRTSVCRRSHVTRDCFCGFDY